MRVEFIIRAVPPDPAIDVSLAAHATLMRLLRTVALPTAQAAAPGSISSNIKVGGVIKTGPYDFRMGLMITGRKTKYGYFAYRNVERGTGVFIGNQPWLIKPRTVDQSGKDVKKVRRAISFDGRAYVHVTARGQKGQHFLRKGLKLAAEMFPMEFANDLARRRSGGVHR